MRASARLSTMKSPTELAATLARQWRDSSVREARLLDPREWPIRLPIGRPKPSVIRNDTSRVRQHLTHWRHVAVGHVEWEDVPYRAVAEPVALPGCRSALSTLHVAGYRMGVATNDSTGGAERALLALGVAQMFEAAYGYDAVANPKPAPDTVHAFCDLTGLKPSQLAMVGDNRHDLQMARAGGVGLAVGVLSGTGTFESLSPLADAVLDSIADLPDFLAVRAAS